MEVHGTPGNSRRPDTQLHVDTAGWNEIPAPSLLNWIWIDQIGGFKSLGLIVGMATLRELSKPYISSLANTVGASFGIKAAAFVLCVAYIRGYYLYNRDNEQDREDVDFNQMYANALGEALDEMTLNEMHERWSQEGGVGGEMPTNNDHFKQD
jgi:hypothetical protein